MSFSQPFQFNSITQQFVPVSPSCSVARSEKSLRLATLDTDFDAKISRLSKAVDLIGSVSSIDFGVDNVDSGVAIKSSEGLSNNSDEFDVLTSDSFFTSVQFDTMKSLNVRMKDVNSHGVFIGRSPMIIDSFFNCFPEVKDVSDILPNMLEKIVRYRIKSFNGTEKLVLKKTDFHGLTRLKALYIEDLTVDSFDEDIFEYLPNLEILHLNNLKLTILPKSIEGLKDLKELKLKRNRLKYIDVDLSKLPFLEKLDLSSNFLRSFDHHSSFLALKHLNLSNNRLGVLPDRPFRKFPHLRELIIRDSRLWTLPKGMLYGLDSLVALDLRYNDIREIVSRTFPELNDEKSLKTIHLSHNPSFGISEQSYLYVVGVDNYSLPNVFDVIRMFH